MVPGQPGRHALHLSSPQSHRTSQTFSGNSWPFIEQIANYRVATRGWLSLLIVTWSLWWGNRRNASGDHCHVRTVYNELRRFASFLSPPMLSLYRLKNLDCRIKDTFEKIERKTRERQSDSYTKNILQDTLHHVHAPKHWCAVVLFDSLHQNSRCKIWWDFRWFTMEWLNILLSMSHIILIAAEIQNRQSYKSLQVTL